MIRPWPGIFGGSCILGLGCGLTSIGCRIRVRVSVSVHLGLGVGSARVRFWPGPVVPYLIQFSFQMVIKGVIKINK